MNSVREQASLVAEMEPLSMTALESSKPLLVESQLPFQQNRALERSPFRQNGHDPTHDVSDSPAEDGVSDPEKPAKRQKRSRACTACRGMKIRCLPVDGQEACLSCAKVNRECIMPGPARKRQKTVHKVAELERKINALTDALIAKNQNDPTPPNDSPATGRSLETQSDLTLSGAPESESARITLNQVERRLVSNAFPSVENREFGLDCSKFTTKPIVSDDYVDVISRGILDMETATLMFDQWKFQMCPYFPAVAMPAHVNAQEVRTAKPMLFLAIISVASSNVHPAYFQDLVVELSRQLADRVLFLGEKSLELVQAILIYTTYYSRSKYGKDLAFNQYIHAAVVMCLDLGMGKRYRMGKITDPLEEAELRRTWLACFYVASSVATLLRHPSLVRWDSYVEECLQFFANNLNVMSSDAWLCSLVNLQHIAEEVAVTFNMDDPSSSISFTESRTQYHLKAFERQLSTWKQSVLPGVDKRLLEHLVHSISLYIHETAIHNDHNVDDFRPNYRRSDEPEVSSGSFVTTAHIDALTTCLDSAHRSLGAFVALDVDVIRTLPNIYFVWDIYAAVALIKLHGVLHAPDSKFGSIFAPDIRVDFYLDALSTKLAEASKDARCPAAEAFGFVAKKLKSWHRHKKAPYLDEDSATDDDRRNPDQAANEKAQLNLMRTFPNVGLPENYSVAFNMNVQSDLNAAYNAANYNINWEDLNFSADELNTFDSYMNDSGWMGYLI